MSDREVVVYAVLAVILWFVPLLNRLHVESMAVLAMVAFFVSGSASIRLLNQEKAPAFGAVLIGRLTRLAVPVILLTISVFWAPNCDYLRGFLFVVLFPVISVVFSVCLAYALVGMGRSRRMHWFVGVLIVVIGPLFDVGFHPQFYTYNHVFGGILGPIYDEELVLRSGLFWYRGLTLCWAGLAYMVGRRLTGETGTGPATAALLITIGALYFFSPFLGMNTPEWYLQSQFSGHAQTAHFDIYYDEEAVDSTEVRQLIIEHEFRYSQLKAGLDEEVEERIQSYVYPDAEKRASLTGARFTSVAPVWLASPQVHVLGTQVQSVFPHELAHVFSREFGLPVIRASLFVGLVEGLAVATEPPDGRPTAHEMVASAAAFRNLEPEAFANQLIRTLSVSGFWGGRGAVSYTVTGSFVRYLLDTYGADPLKRSYATGNFERGYGKSVSTLSREWLAFLHSIPAIDRSAAWRANAAFSVPSLFERNCPHWVPEPARHTRAARSLLEDGDAESAFELLTDVLADRPDYSAAWGLWGRASLALGRSLTVEESLLNRPDSLRSVAEKLALADASAILGNVDVARDLYTAIRDLYPVYARETRALLALRSHTADSPDVMRVLVSSDSIAERRSLLESILVDKEIGVRYRSEGGHLWRARLLAEEGNFGDATAVLERVMGSNDGPCAATISTTAPMCSVWASNYAFGAGDIPVALTFARRAQADFQRTGDLSMVRLLADHIRKLEWSLENSALIIQVEST